jgi:hypothetical protein
MAYILFVVGLYVWAMRPELGQYARMRGTGTDPTNEEIAIEFGMGRGLGRALDCHAPLPAIARRMRGRGGADGTP